MLIRGFSKLAICKSRLNTFNAGGGKHLLKYVAKTVAATQWGPGILPSAHTVGSARRHAMLVQDTNLLLSCW